MELICYLSNGYPSIADSIQMARNYANSGCDVIEIDFPARDPFLESPFLQDRMRQALESCGNYDDYMEGMIETKRLLPNTKFILLAYEETIREIGDAKFISFCTGNNFMDLILVGIKDDDLKNRLIARRIRVSCYVQFHLLTEEVRHATESNGFVYMQGKPSGNNINSEYPTLRDCISFLRNQGITTPIYCGVGIHTPQDVKMVKEAGADGVFIGSAILKLHNDIPALSEAIKAFKAMC